MTAHNMPILYQNILYGLPSDLARDAFLWACERTQNDRFLYKAEAFAREADALSGTVRSLIDLSQYTTLKNGGLIMNDTHRHDLLNFIMKRHANHRFGGNVAPTYEVTA